MPHKKFYIGSSYEKFIDVNEKMDWVKISWQWTLKKCNKMIRQFFFNKNALNSLKITHINTYSKKKRMWFSHVHVHGHDSICKTNFNIIYIFYFSDGTDVKQNVPYFILADAIDTSRIYIIDAVFVLFSIYFITFNRVLARKLVEKKQQHQQKPNNNRCVHVLYLWFVPYEYNLYIFSHNVIWQLCYKNIGKKIEWQQTRSTNNIVTKDNESNVKSFEWMYSLYLILYFV